jgi:hypothetical protein
MESAWTLISTPFGRAIGFLATRDMVCFSDAAVRGRDSKPAVLAGLLD